MPSVCVGGFDLSAKVERIIGLLTSVGCVCVCHFLRTVLFDLNVEKLDFDLKFGFI